MQAKKGPESEWQMIRAALEKARACAIAAENAAAEAKAQATAASKDATELRASLAALQERRDERMQEDLKSIKYFGRFLALVVRNIGISATAIVVGFFFVAPIAYPLLLRAYLSIAPDDLRDFYAEKVTTPLLTKVLRSVVEKNDERLDFVQHLQQTWSQEPPPPRLPPAPPVYNFPLVAGQTFTVHVRSSTGDSKECTSDDGLQTAAAAALGDKKLFSVYVQNGSIAKSPLAEEIAGNDSHGKFIHPPADYWKGSAPSSSIMTVAVMLDTAKARPIWHCYGVLRTDLVVTVKKSLKDSLFALPTTEVK